MKKLSRFFAIMILVGATAFMFYGAYTLEQQKIIQEENERLAREQAEREAEAARQAAIKAAEEARLEAERIAAEKARLEALALEEARRNNPAYNKDVDIAELQSSTNQDIYAWVYIPDSKIDYPVLQHPSNNRYYLDYNIDGSKGYPGCIYSENYNNKYFTDPVTVLYGHNMKNGSMFAGLHKYEDSEYFAEHPYVYIYTDANILKYEIFAAYEYSNLHILLNYDFSNKDVYQQYIDKIYTYKGIFNKDLEVSSDNNILTLSTCVANQASKRFVVQGVLIEILDYLEES